MSQEPFQNLALFRLPPDFRGRGALWVQLWWIVQSLLIHPSPQAFYAWRRSLLRFFGAKIGKDVILRPSVRVTYPWKLTIGDRAWIGDRVELYTLGKIDIGADAVISQDCYICTGGHDPARRDFAIYSAPVHIGAQAWLAAGCFVMPGVSIAIGTFCKVRSLVTCDTDEGDIVAGSPAMTVGKRSGLSPLPIDAQGRLQPRGRP